MCCNMDGKLFQVKTRSTGSNGFPGVEYELVVAQSMDKALDKVSASLDQNESLYDEEMQRAIANGDVDNGRVERNYTDYIVEKDCIE